MPAHDGVGSHDGRHTVKEAAPEPFTFRREASALVVVQRLSEEQAELELRDREEVLVHVERRIEDHLHTGRAPLTSSP